MKLWEFIGIAKSFDEGHCSYVCTMTDQYCGVNDQEPVINYGNSMAENRSLTHIYYNQSC